MGPDGILTRLDSIVSARHLLQHPFYREWTAGTLPSSALRDYAAQYYSHVEAFPRYLSAIHSRCDEMETRQALLENLIEEERGEQNHPELWLRFAEGVGVSRAQVRATIPHPTTRKLVGTFMRLSREGPYEAGLTALYAYESQMPAIAAAKIEGLKLYGVAADDALAFFRVHREADVDHARTVGAIIERRTSNDAVRGATLAAAEEALSALWEMLDGIRR